MFEDLEDFCRPHITTVKLKVKRIVVEDEDGYEIIIVGPKDTTMTFSKELHPGDVFGARYIASGSVSFKKVERVNLKMKLGED